MQSIKLDSVYDTKPNEEFKPRFKVNITGGEMSDEELMKYIERGKSLNKNKILVGIDINICDNDELEIHYHYHQPFERIRRITG